MIRVVIADDHQVVRDGLAFLLGQEPDIDVVHQAADGKAALDAVRALRPDVLLLDLFMPQLSGVDVLDSLKAESAATAAVVLTSSSDHEDVVKALRSGALSYVLKSAPVGDIVAAVRDATRGRSMLTDSIAHTLATAIREGTQVSPIDRLSNREREVLVEIANGRSNRQIAHTLHIAEETVKSHVSNIFAKLDVEDRTQAAIVALRHRLVALE
jgi:NarL family two-component system response regulator LiaR